MFSLFFAFRPPQAPRTTRCHPEYRSRSSLNDTCLRCIAGDSGEQTCARAAAAWVLAPVDSSTEFILWNAGLRVTVANDREVEASSPNPRHPHRPTQVPQSSTK